MALTCNIDRRGRRIRGISGAIVDLLGTLIIILNWPPTWWQWTLGVVLMVLGFFQVFEAAIGWCAVRAMGFKTRV